MDIALYQPDQPPNVGTMMRLGACMECPVHVIEPCGFPFSPKAVKRYAMDYSDHVELQQHLDWNHFNDWRTGTRKRLILLTTQAATPYTGFQFENDDILMVGSESTGVPASVHEAVDARITIPMTADTRSLNVAVSLSMVLGEALRQTNSWPKG